MSSSKCLSCGRGLKDVKSRHRGYGPICWSRIQAEKAAHGDQYNEQILLPFNGDVILVKAQNGRISTNVPHRIVKHSPTGFSWGYGGSGPADLALNILALFVGPEVQNNPGLYQAFKNEFITTMPEYGGKIKKAAIMYWLERHGVKQNYKEGH